MNPYSPIIFYDVNSSLSPPAWDSYGWRIRLILNYKNLCYKTKFVPFPDIATTVSRLGVRGNRNPPYYTLPAIRAENKLEVIMNCFDIAVYLDSEYKATRVIPREDKELQASYADQINNVVHSRMLPLLLPTIWKIMEEGRERETWLNVMIEKFGPKANNERQCEQRERCWKHLQEGLTILSELLDSFNHGEDSPWPFGGRHPTYADFSLCASFIWFDKASLDGGWQRIEGWHGGKWKRLYEMCVPFMKVDLGDREEDLRTLS